MLHVELYTELLVQINNHHLSAGINYKARDYLVSLLRFDDMMHCCFVAVLSGTGVYIHVQITKFNLLCFFYALHLCWLLHLRVALMLYITVHWCLCVRYVTCDISVTYFDTLYRVMITRYWQVVYLTGS